MNIINILKTVLSAIRFDSLPLYTKVSIFLAIVLGASVPGLQDYSNELLSLARDIALSFSGESR